MVAILGLHKTYSWDLSLISQVSLLIFAFLGRTHLLRYDLLGPWYSARAQVHHPPPPTITISLLLKELIILLREAKNNFIEQKLLKLVLRVY